MKSREVTRTIREKGKGDRRLKEKKGCEDTIVRKGGKKVKRRRKGKEGG